MTSIATGQNSRRRLRDLNLPYHRAAGAALWAGLLATLAACHSSGNSAVEITDLNVGQVKAEIALIPTGTQCIVLTITGTSGNPPAPVTVTDSFDVTAGTSATFALANLPIGTDTFTANAYPVPCSQVTPTTQFIYTASNSGTVPATLNVQNPFSITLNFGTGSGEGYVLVNFPAPSTSFIEYSVNASPTPPNGNNGYLTAFIAAGPDGNVWFASPAGLIQTITPTASGQTVGVLNTPNGNLPANSIPGAIVAGSDGNMWFVDSGTQSIGRITPASGAVQEYSIVSLTSGLTIGDVSIISMTTGSDGALWFTMQCSPLCRFGFGIIGRLTTAGTLNLYSLPGSSSSPEGITSGSDGNIWFADNGARSIGCITTGTDGAAPGTITELAVPASGAPAGITAGPDGNIWFTDRASGGIGSLSTVCNSSNSTITEYNSDIAGFTAFAITAGPDGNIWFTDSATSSIGRIGTGTATSGIPLGAITEFTPPGNVDNASIIQDIAVGPDGNLWFIQSGKVGTFVLF